MHEMLGQFLFRRLLGLIYALAFASFLSMSDAMFACSGLVPVEPRFGVSVAAVFALGVLGLFGSIALVAFNQSVALLPLWLLFLACNIMGTDLFFFREYDIFLLEVGLYAIFFTGEIGKQMSSWALFRYCFSYAFSFFSCPGGIWENLVWFKYAFTTVGPLNPAWHFASSFSLLTINYATAFVLVAFLLSGLCVCPHGKGAARYVFWAGVLYKGVVQNSAWIILIFFALTTHMQSDAALLTAYPPGLFRNLGLPLQLKQDTKELTIKPLVFVKVLLGFVSFCIIPIFVALRYFRVVELLSVDSLVLVGVSILFLHILTLLFRRRIASLLACTLSVAGFATMVPASALAKLNLPELSGVELFRYAHPTECPEPTTHRNIVFCGNHGEIMREETVYAMNTKYSVADAEAHWPVSMPFPTRLEEAIVRVARERPKEMPRWLKRMLLHVSIRDPNVGQLFEHAKFKDTLSVYGSSKPIDYVYALDAIRTPTSDLRGHTWWTLPSQNVRALFPVISTTEFKPDSCPPPSAWIGLPLLQISVTLIVVVFTGKILLRVTNRKPQD